MKGVKNLFEYLLAINDHDVGCISASRDAIPQKTPHPDMIVGELPGIFYGLTQCNFGCSNLSLQISWTCVADTADVVCHLATFLCCIQCKYSTVQSHAHLHQKLTCLHAVWVTGIVHIIPPLISLHRSFDLNFPMRLKDSQ